jgi:MFS transporter, PAT family, beta-lactamase induction signal transducer AmpG
MTPADPAAEPDRKTLLKAIFSKNMLICAFNGFTAGMPLWFLYQLVPAWLRTQGVDLKTIGLFALIGLPYTWKFLWSPFLDQYVPPFLGRRRGWMLITQVALFLSIAGIGQLDPAANPLIVAYVAAAIAFFSASQDIVLDAYRRELLPDEELGLGNSLYIQGYRVSSIIPGGLGLILADRVSWPTVHFVVACFMSVGIVKTLLIDEAATRIRPPRSIGDAVVEPFKEFFTRKGGIGSAFRILAFIFLYKIGDSMATALVTPFYLDVGFSMTQIGSLVKVINLAAMIVGTFVGGAIIFKIGINRSLWIFGVVQMVSILGFAVLSEVGNDVRVLAVVIAFEYLGVGMGSSVLVAFMARATNTDFTATQFALFSSLIALPRTFANAVTGFLIEGVGPEDGLYYRIFGELGGLGYTNFFLLCTLCAIPGMVLLFWVAPWHAEAEPTPEESRP